MNGINPMTRETYSQLHSLMQNVAAISAAVFADDRAEAFVDRFEDTAYPERLDLCIEAAVALTDIEDGSQQMYAEQDVDWYDLVDAIAVRLLTLESWPYATHSEIVSGDVRTIVAECIQNAEFDVTRGVIRSGCTSQNSFELRLRAIRSGWDAKHPAHSGIAPSDIDSATQETK
jgi:hypothetical protein